MSCWRTQIVLRLPGAALGIRSMEEWETFERRYRRKLSWEEGHFAPALCTYEQGPFLDYILSDRAPVATSYGCVYDARPLTPTEKKRYMPVYKKLFPDFTWEQMDQVHYCECTWYDGTEAPYCY